GSDSGTTNMRHFSSTCRMEQGTEEVDKQQEGDESHILKTSVMDKSLKSSRLKLSSQYQTALSQYKIQQNKEQTQTRSIPGIYNKIVDALSKLITKGDYSVKKEIFIALCQVQEMIPTLDLFATEENKLVDRFVAIGEEEEGAEWLNAFFKPWRGKIFWIDPPFPKIGKALIAWEKFKPKSILIANWRPGQVWFTHLLTDSSKYFILGESSLILNPGKEMMKRKDMLPPKKIAALLMYQELIIEGNQQQSSQTTQT
ncbi:MAG: hypothetical protein EZS28_030514, partial [Streblomastix strix]